MAVAATMMRVGELNPVMRSLSAEMEKERKMKAELIMEMEDWPCMRRVAYQVMSTQRFDVAVGAIIAFNMVLVILETDCLAQEDGCSSKWIDMANNSLLCAYCLELLTKLYAFRKKFFADNWNLVDLAVVAIDLILVFCGIVIGGLPSVSILRIFRLLRLVRALKAASYVQELKHLLLSLANAIRACIWGMFLIIVLLALYAIMAVQLVQPISKEVAAMGGYSDDCVRCPYAYETVFKATLTLFQQCVTGDNWGELTIPIIEHAPWTGVLFISIMITIHLAMLNLVVAVIVESSMEMVCEDQHTKALEQELKMANAKKELLAQIIDIDTKKNGAVTVENFHEAFNTHQKFTDALKALDITKDDLDTVFQLVDTDGSGDVDYQEFVDQLYRLKCNNQQLILFSIADIQKKLGEICWAAGIGSCKRRSSKTDSVRRAQEFQPETDLEAGQFLGLLGKGDVGPDQLRNETQSTLDSLLNAVFESLSRSQSEILDKIKAFESSTSRHCETRSARDAPVDGIQSFSHSVIADHDVIVMDSYDESFQLARRKVYL